MGDVPEAQRKVKRCTYARHDERSRDGQLCVLLLHARCYSRNQRLSLCVYIYTHIHLVFVDTPIPLGGGLRARCCPVFGMRWYDIPEVYTAVRLFYANRVDHCMCECRVQEVVQCLAGTGLVSPLGPSRQRSKPQKQDTAAFARQGRRLHTFDIACARAVRLLALL